MAGPAPAVVPGAPRSGLPPDPDLPAGPPACAAPVPRAGPRVPAPAPAPTLLRAPVPRVKRYTTPDARLAADARIQALVTMASGDAGTVLGADQGPPAQAEAPVAFLRARGYLP